MNCRCPAWEVSAVLADDKIPKKPSSASRTMSHQRRSIESTWPTGGVSLWRQPEVDFDVDDFVTEQLFCHSKDGTRIPIIVTRRKDTKLDGSNRTLLYAYGGFNISLTPSFSPATAAWIDSGGVYAVANLRGGGEYGRQWHEDGMRLKKQNVFDDFIAAAECLIENGYTTPQRLAIRGGSNGGLLVGAVMTQRPELFGAACRRSA